MTGEPYSRDPRYIARRPRPYSAAPGSRQELLGTRGRVLHLQRRAVRPGHQLQGYYSLDSDEGIWNSGKDRQAEPRLPTALQGRLLPGPADRQARQDLRSEMVLKLLSRSASRSRRTTTRSPPPARPRSTSGSTRCCKMADKLMMFKYVIKNVAYGNGYTATFMPKPLFGTTARACTSTRASGRTTPTCSSRTRGYAGLSQMAALVHRRPAQARAGAARALCADDQLLSTAGPRLRGAGQPDLLAAQSAAPIRIPMYSSSPKAKRLEFRCPDPTPTLPGLPAMLMAGLDGDQTRSSRRRRSTRTCTTSSQRKAIEIKSTPGSLPRCSTRWRPIRSSCFGATSSPGRDRPGSTTSASARRWRPPPAPVRVPPVLRHVS